MPLSDIIFQDASKQVCQNLPLSGFLATCYHNELRTSMAFHSFSCWSFRTPRNKGQSHASPCTAQRDKTRSAFFTYVCLIQQHRSDAVYLVPAPAQVRYPVGGDVRGTSGWAIVFSCCRLVCDLFFLNKTALPHKTKVVSRLIKVNMNNMAPGCIVL
jgi:hypothetical protein